MSRKSTLGFFARPAQFALYFLSGFFRRDSELWVFGAWGGNRLPGNAAAVFRFADDQTRTGPPPVWISYNAEVRRLLRREGRIALHPWSWRGLLTCLRAGIYVYDVCGNDINFWLSRGARNVLLRHGTGIKKVGRAIDNPTHHLHRLYHGTLLQRLVLGFLLPWHHTKYDLVIASSRQHAKQASEFFLVDQKNIAVTGSPRNDVLFDAVPSDRQDPAADWIRQCQANKRPVCLYMPTFRDDRRSAFPYPWRVLDEICARKGISILVRLHPVDRSSPAAAEIAELKYLRLHDTDQDPALLFGDTDCMITDYSSVVYDYMLLQKPVLFFCHDLPAYLEKSRELYFDLDAVTPGPVTQNLDQLASALGDLASGKLAEQPAGARYRDTLALFHEHKDGASCERVWAEIRRRFCQASPIKENWSETEATHDKEPT